MDGSDARRYSPRLHNALIADLLQDAEENEGDELLLRKFADEYEWTEHLGRQLGVRTDGPGGVHDTLMFLLPELDRMLSEWPIPTEGKGCDVLAREATKSLSPLEAYATLLAGPKKWRKASIDAPSTVEGLATRLRTILERSLASALRGVLADWNSWDVRRLRDRWEEAKRRRAELNAQADTQSAVPGRTRPEESPEDRRRWRQAASYRAPGRVT